MSSSSLSSYLIRRRSSNGGDMRVRSHRTCSAPSRRRTHQHKHNELCKHRFGLRHTLTRTPHFQQRLAHGLLSRNPALHADRSPLPVRATSGNTIALLPNTRMLVDGRTPSTMPVKVLLPNVLTTLLPTHHIAALCRLSLLSAMATPSEGFCFPGHVAATRTLACVLACLVMRVMVRAAHHSLVAQGLESVGANGPAQAARVLPDFDGRILRRLVWICAATILAL